MSDKKPKNETTFLDEDSVDDIFESTPGASSNKRIRKVSPLGMRILVRIKSADETTDGGLYLPQGAKDKMSESVLAEVLEVASAIDQDTDEEANVSGIPEDSTVLIDRNAGTKVPWDDALRIVETKDVLAIVNEFDLI